MDKVKHVQLLLNSYRDLVGEDLIKRGQTAMEDFQFMEDSDRVLVSHNGAEDPILNYGNAKALSLWELNWDQFTQTPSRKTAEADLRERRAEMLAIAEKQGYFDGYEGIRISSTGRRFEIKNAVIWNVLNEQGQKIGQAATFTEIRFL